jgi:lipopolysaccharide/colanic/teichoic acid biosynthesis glycosyltransferase
MKFKYKITKQILDSVCGTVAFIICIPIYIIIGIAIIATEGGHVFYKQERIR